MGINFRENKLLEGVTRGAKLPLIQRQIFLKQST